MSEPVLKLQAISQIGMVVRDLEKSMEAYWRVFGVGPWRVYTFGPETANEMYYRGKPAHYHIRIGQASIGEISLELIQPLEGDTVHKDYLEEHGEGVQHLNFRLPGLEDAMEKMHKAGFELIQHSTGTGLSSDGAHAYFDTCKELGIVFELSQPPSQWRADYWYPAPPPEA